MGKYRSAEPEKIDEICCDLNEGGDVIPINSQESHHVTYI